MGLSGPGVDAWVWMLGPFDLTAWVLNVTGTPNAPKVQSISYGSPETAFKLPDMERDNTEFQKNGFARLHSASCVGRQWTRENGPVSLQVLQSQLSCHLAIYHRCRRNLAHWNC